MVHCIFPDAEAADAPRLNSDREWTKVSGGLESGADYWWRPGILETSEPEISLTSPSNFNPWRTAVLDNGRQYQWRDNPDDPDDPEIRLWTEETTEEGGVIWRSSSDETSLASPFE